MSVPRLRGRPGGGDALALLLRADRFRLGRDATRAAHNLAQHGGVVDGNAAAWIGADLPPLGAPSITLGGARGTLGPFSFGFLDNTRDRGAAPFAAPLPARPRRGPIAIVCGRRDALPDIAPLVLARGLGVSYLISVGDGAVEEPLAFLATDETTRAVLLAATARATPKSLAALAGKPAVLLGGDPLTRAAARRAGGAEAADLEGWLARGTLLELGAVAPRQPVAIVIGGGAPLVAETLRAAGLVLPVRTVEDEDPDEMARAISRAAAEGDLVLAVGPGPLDALPPPTDGARGPLLFVDAGHLERLRAIAQVIVAERAAGAEAVTRAAPPVDADRAQARAIVDEAGPEIGDHDTKRLLKLYGCRVTRQAPAGSATAAARIAAQVGLPVDLVPGALPGRGPAAREATRRAASPAAVKHGAALLLEGAPFVLVREVFPDAPRAHLALRRDKAFGAYAAISPRAGGEGDARALLPLARADALLLARAAPGAAEIELADLLVRACAAASELELAVDLELFTGGAPAVLAASATRARR